MIVYNVSSFDFTSGITALVTQDKLTHWAFSFEVPLSVYLWVLLSLTYIIILGADYTC